MVNTITVHHVVPGSTSGHMYLQHSIANTACTNTDHCTILLKSCCQSGCNISEWVRNFTQNNWKQNKKCSKNLCHMWTVEKRMEEDEYIFSRKSLVSGVGVGQSHQLFSSPLKAADSFMGQWLSPGRSLWEELVGAESHVSVLFEFNGLLLHETQKLRNDSKVAFSYSYLHQEKTVFKVSDFLKGEFRYF